MDPIHKQKLEQFRNFLGAYIPPPKKKPSRVNGRKCLRFVKNPRATDQFLRLTVILLMSKSFPLPSLIRQLRCEDIRVT